MQHLFCQIALPTAQACSATQAESRLAPVQIHLCKSALHTGVHLPTTTALQHWLWQNAVPLLSAALQPRLTAGLYQCRYTCANMLCIQVCTDPPPLQCSTGFGKIQTPLLSAALQPRLTAGLYQCRYTCANMLCIQVCTDPPPLQCSTGFGKIQTPLLSAAVQHRLTQACTWADTPMQICSAYRCSLTHHHCNAALVLPNCTPHCSGLLSNPG